MFKRRFLIGRRQLRKPPHWPTTLRDEKNKAVYLKKIFLIILIIGWIYLLLFSSSFQVAAVEIIGGDNSLNENLKEFFSSRFKDSNWLKKNIFTFEIQDLNELKEIWGLKEIDYQKNYLDRALYFRYEKKEPRAILQWQGHEFSLDDQGQIIQEEKELEKLDPGLPLILLNDIQISGKNPLTASLINSLYKINKKTEELSLKIVSFRVENSPELPLNKKEDGQPESSNIQFGKLNELTALTNIGFLIYFGENIFKDKNDLDQQLDNLEIFIKDKFKKINPKQLSYIDLRFGDKIFYK